MLINMKSNSKVGKAITETASIAYTGKLLPAGTASYGSELYQVGFPTIDASKNNATNYYTDLGNDTFRLLQTDTSIIPTLAITALEIPLVVGKYYNINMTLSSVVGSVKSDAFGGIFLKDGDNLLLCTGTLFNFYRQAVPADVTFKINSIKEVLINPNLRYLENSGKDKTPTLVESGKGKFFNGTNQYINTGIIPNQAQGTLVTRFTYVTGQVSRCIYGTSEISIWVNASGKIEGLFGNAVITSTDVLVNGRSYHVELPYLGLDASIKVDNIAKASGTASSFTTTLPIFIGARNNSGTADGYFNNVIDETYYYDVALSDSQIQSIYLYPEKVKSYNGAIVPDIGSEANCKLFLPMCENSGSNVVNVAVANNHNYYDYTANPIKVSDTEVSTLVKNATNDYTISVTTVGSNTTRPQLSYYTDGITNYTNGMYVCTMDYEVLSGVPKLASINIGLGGTPAPTAVTLSGSGTLMYTQNVTSTLTRTAMYWDGTNLFSVRIKNVKIIKLEAYPLVNYTTAMHTSAAKLSYGAQCIAWKRDSLGVLLGMSGSMSYDTNVSVKPVFTSWTPKYNEDWCCEVIQYNDGVGIELNGVNATTRFSIGMNGIYAYINATGVFKSVIVATGWHHLFVRYTASTKTFVLTLNGVAQSPLVSSSFTSDPLYSFCIGAERTGASTSGFYIGNRVILKQYNAIQSTKITEAKSWANAQKTIAKLGA